MELCSSTITTRAVLNNIPYHHPVAIFRVGGNALCTTPDQRRSRYERTKMQHAASLLEFPQSWSPILASFFVEDGVIITTATR
jgi:hypothetical protein